MARITLALLLILLATSGGAGAQNVPRSAVCTADNSAPAEIAAIAASPASWMGKCVVVDGLYSDERVYRDVDAIYGVTAASVGGYIDGLGQLPGAWRGSFVGRVSDCAEAEETLLTAQLRAPGISLHGRVLGCTTPEGPFLMFMSTTGEFAPSGVKRRLRGAKGGDLIEAPADWPHRDAVSDLTLEIILAMDQGSAARLGQLLGNAYQAERIIAGDIEVFSRGKIGMRTWISMFVDKDVTGDQMAAESCWTLKDDLKVEWPIDSRDADNQPSRPYACLRIEGVMREGRWRYRVDASHDVAGLEEP
jgi:hypothetical protein